MTTGPMSDCYVLAPVRSADVALAFLDTFVPCREQTWDSSDPVDVLGVPPKHSLEDLLRFLEIHTDCDYRMYFRNREPKSPYYALLAYCKDGSLILGVSGDEDERSALELLRRLERFTGSRGYWSVEEAPPCNEDEFAVRVNASSNGQSAPKADGRSGSW